jgi:hypothetical protein
MFRFARVHVNLAEDACEAKKSCEAKKVCADYATANEKKVTRTKPCIKG